jgi:dCMP deaminase
MIIGVAGLNGSGKGEVVRYLEERSFYVLSLSDVLRDVLRERGLEESRDQMIRVGQELRAQRGPGVLAQRLAEGLEPDRNYAIDSIRHPAEVEILRGRTRDFQLLWIDAPEEVRFERVRARGRAGDPTSLEELRAFEARETRSDDPNAQQLARVRELADYEVANQGGLSELHDAVQRILERSLFFERPGWDEYFMSIARMVASRSNCVKRKVGTVVTKDRRIISTGYNGTPRGTRNCNEGGCPRCNSFAPQGTALADCLCSHAEENAITQAAYHGVRLQGGSIYTTFSPCLQCTKMIINVGLVEVVYNAHYPLGQVALDLLREAGVKTRRFELKS